ncbi:MAG: DNA recombination protein RmuC [Acidobacteria bacterium]|nr:DNA recombination protein RmuC [Acidobacteriota bacterium]
MNEWPLILVAFLLGGGLAWALARARSAGAEARAAELRQQLESAREEARALNTRLTEAEKSRTAAETRASETEKNLAAQKALLEEAKARLSETFKSLAADALAGSNRSFLVLAEEKFKALNQPLTEALSAYQKEAQDLEHKRQRELGSVNALLATLQAETTKLAGALRSSQLRGRWGEMTLRRAAEVAGMSIHCDFVEQETAGDGRLRPDMIIRLPAGRSIVVDAKVPLDGYLDAMDAATDQARQAGLARYASQVNRHITNLSSREYWDQFPEAPEFVVLFIPNDSFLAAAAEADPNLLQTALARKIILATPSTFIALLLAVSYGWRQEKLADSAQKISDLGQELYERMGTLAEHLAKIGGSLGKAVESYNEAVGSWERRVLPAARKFKELGAGGKKDLDELQPIDQGLRPLTAPEADEQS